MIEIMATKQPIWAGNCVEIRIIDRDKNQYAESVVMKTGNIGDEIPAAFRLKPNQAQALIDHLWDCGFRPTEGTGSAGALAAVERHLADMKQIAFHALKINVK